MGIAALRAGQWYFRFLRLRLKREIGRRESLTSLFRRLINNLNLSDFSDIKQVDGQIRFRETKVVWMDNLNWLKRLFHEDFAKDCQKNQESRRICCNETDHARQARLEELSMQQQRNLTIVFQMMAQIRNLQNKENSLSDAREFYDPELGSSSGATHVPDQASSISESQNLAALRFWIAAWYTEWVRVLQETFFWTMTCSRRTTLCNLPQFKDFGIFSSGLGTVECAYSITPLPKLKWYVQSYLWNLSLREYDGLSENSRYGMESWKIAWLWNFKAGKSTSELRFVHDQPILISLRSGSKKLRLPNLLTNLWHRDRLQGSLILLISICFMRWLCQAVNFPNKRKCRRAPAENSDQFLQRRQIAFMIFEFFRATGAFEAVQGLADLFTISLQNDDDIQDFDVLSDHALFNSKRNVFTVVLGRIVHVKITEFSSTSVCDGLVWSRRCTKQWAAESSSIEHRSETSLWSDDEKLKLQNPKRSCRTRISYLESKKETKPAVRWKWESVFNGRHMDNAPQEIHVVLVMTHSPVERRVKVRDEKGDRVLPLSMRRQNFLTARNTNPHSDQAIHTKTRKTRMKFHADSNAVKICHVDSVILPCVWITNLTKDVCHFRFIEAEGQTNKKSKKGGAKGSVAILKESTQWGCVS